MLPDGELREDDMTYERLTDYPLVVVPDCYVLTANQQSILEKYAQNGGKLLVAGRIAEGTDLKNDLEKSSNAVFVPIDGSKEEYMPEFMKEFARLYDDISPVVCDAENVGIQRYDNGKKTWVHILNYDYDEKEDRVKPIPELKLEIRNVNGRDPVVLTPEGIEPPRMLAQESREGISITLCNVGVYSVIAV